MNITIFGAGYVGLVTATCFAELKHTVHLYDLDKSKVISLKRGKISIYEPGLEELFNKHLKRKTLSVESRFDDAINASDIYFICVGTPQYKSGKPNLKYIFDITKNIKNSFVKNKNYNDKFLVYKSTIPPGTIKKIETKYFNDQNQHIHLGSNPEFLREGNAIFDFMNSERIVIGSNSKKFKETLKKIYSSLLGKNTILVNTDPQSSEIIKYGANAFLATKISFINELSRLSDSVGGNIKDISQGIGLDKRIGNNFLNAGIGFGGSCFPKDINGLAYTFQGNYLRSEIIESVINVNKSQAKYFLNKILKLFSKKELKTKSILVLGSAFKPNTDDIRESVSIKLIKMLSTKVNRIGVYEPIAMKNSRKDLSNFRNVKFEPSISAKIFSKYDTAIVATEYEEFLEINVRDFLNLKDKTIFDGRNILDQKKFERQGIRYIGVGI